MRIWAIQTSERLPVGDDLRKLRTCLLSEQLVARGHEVVWWASAFNHLRKEWYFSRDTVIEADEGFSIRALRGFGYRSNVSLARLVDHRLLAWKFRDVAPNEPAPDLIVCSMPSYDLAWQAVKYAKERGIPIVLDVRDQWPDNFLDAFPVRLRRIGRWALGTEFRMLEEALRGATAIVSMSEDLLAWGISRAGRERTSPDRVFHLGYKRGERVEGGNEIVPGLGSPDADRFVVSFIGTFAKYHNPEILVAAARRLAGTGVLVVLAGDGEFRADLMRAAQDLPNVVFPGWLDQREISYLLQRSHLGVCTSAMGDGQLFFPNKVFSYWSEGLPVASGFRGEIEEVIDQEGVGFTFGSVDELVAGILRLKDDPDQYSRMREASRRLFDERYEANRLYGAYADYLAEIGTGTL